MSQSQSLRPLLPATESSGSRGSGSPESSGPGQRQHKRAPIKAACEACRKRKSKCSAERPRCSICIERNTPCEYKTLPTETHLNAQKRRISTLQSRCDTHEALYDILRAKQEDEAVSILQRIRAGTDVETIVRTIQEGDLLLQLSVRPEFRYRYRFPYQKEMPAYLKSNAWSNPYLSSALFEKTYMADLKDQSSDEVLPKSGKHDNQRMYLVPYHAAEMLDARLISLDVAKWTAVPASNPLLRSLLEICESARETTRTLQSMDCHGSTRIRHKQSWHSEDKVNKHELISTITDLIFEYPFHPFFQKDLFLDDMLNGRQRFCTPLLVNAVLAAAWHGYHAVQSRAEHWRPDNLGYRFYAEAQRLLHREQGKAKMTSVQAMCIMSITFTSNGLDALSWPLLQRAIEMAQQLGLFRLSPESDPLWQKAAAITSWGIFNWQALHCYHMFRLPILLEPPTYDLPDVQQASSFFGDVYIRYPGGQQQIDIFHGHMFRAISGFRIILNAVAVELYGHEQSGLSLERLDHFWQAIAKWYRSLPPCLRAERVALPSHLKLHMHMHILIIGLFEPFTQHVQSLSVRGLPDPGEIIAQSKASLETLVRLYYLRHGFESYDPTMILFISMLAWSCLEDYKQMRVDNSPHLDAARSTLVLCAKGLWDQSGNCFISEVLFRLFKYSLPSKDEARLLREVAEGDIEDSGRVSRMVQEVHSAWPVGIFSTAKTSIEDASLSRFIAWCEQVSEDPSQRATAQTLDQPDSPDASWIAYHS